MDSEEIRAAMADMAERARTILSTKGWHQGDFTDERTGAVCIRQAMREAEVELGSPMGYDRPPLEETLASEMEYELCYDLTAWNDESVRSLDDVDHLLARFSKRYRSEVT